MRPKVELENYDAVYDFYEYYQPNETLARIGHFAMNMAFRPHITFADGAETAIQDHLNNDTRFIIPANHLSDKDQYVVAAMARQAKILRPLIGNTDIPTKPSLSHNPLLRYAIDIMGSIPVIRAKDISDEETKDLQREARIRYEQVQANRIANGFHLALFPEGTRNTTDPYNVQEIKHGVGNILQRLPFSNVALLPVGLWYGMGDQKDMRHPEVFIGNPVVEGIKDREKVLSIVHNELQICVDSAIDYFQLRRAS